MPRDHAAAPARGRLLSLVLVVLLASAGAAAADTGAPERIRQHLDAGSPKEAVLEARNALQSDPGDERARSLLVEAYLRLGAGALAEEALVEAQARGLPAEYWLAPLGRAYLLQGKAEELLQEIRFAGAMPAAVRAEAVALGGLAQLMLERADASRAAFDKALEVDPDNAQARLGLALLAIAAGEYGEAEGQIAQAKTSSGPEVWRVEAALQRARDELDAAADAYSRALDLAPGDLRTLLARATVHVARGEPEAAIADLDEARALAPGLAEAEFLHALADQRRGELAAARDRLNVLLNRDPDHLRARLLAGLVHLQLDELEQAEERLQPVVAAAPDNALAVRALATVRLRQNRLDRAIELLEPLGERFPEDAAVLGALGGAYLQSRRYDEGLTYAEKALTLSPDAPELKLRLAWGRLATGDSSGALDLLGSVEGTAEDFHGDEFLRLLAQIQDRRFEQAVKTAGQLAGRLPGNPAPFYFRGLAHLQLGQGAKARADFERALEISPGFAPPALALARLAILDGRTDEATARYDGVLAEAPDNLEALLGRAALARADGSREAAIDLLERARRAHPRSPLPGTALVQAHLAAGQHEQAAGVARALLRGHPEEPRAVQAMVLALVAQEDFAGALRHQEQQVRLSPRSPEVHRQLAVLQLRTGDPDAARESIGRALALDPDHLPALASAAELSAQAGHTDEALKHARRIRQLQPDGALGHRLEGDALLAASAAQEAAAAYRRAFDIAPGTALLVKLADALGRSGRREEALGQLSGWLGDHPEDGAARLLLAGLALEADRRGEAIAAYQRVLEQAPDNLVALNNLAWLYHEQGDSRALGLAERARAAAPRSAAVADTLGWVLVGSGEPGRGLALIEEAYRGMPEDPRVRYHLAVAYKATGRPELARPHLQALLEGDTDFPERGEAQRLHAELRSD